jgi:hypothetical protein
MSLMTKKWENMTPAVRESLVSEFRMGVAGQKMGMDLTSDGDFWVPEAPEVRVRGRFTAGSGREAEVLLQGAVVDDPRVRPTGGGVAFTGAADDWVQSFLPITLHGQLDTGEPVTLLNAQNYGGDGAHFGNPRYVSHSFVRGEHVAGIDQVVNAVRFRVGHPYWLAHLENGDSYTAEDRATLVVEASEDGNWLVYIPPEPASMRRLEVIAVSGTAALMELALDQKVSTRETQMRLDEDAPWITVDGEAFSTGEPEFDPDSLLPREELTVERLCKWVALNDGLDGLAHAVARPLDGALQAQVLVVTTVVEGIHRRLPFEQSKFPEASKAALRAVLNSVRETARAEAEVHGLDPKAVEDSVLFLTDVSYRTRATDIVTEVCAAIPEIGESVVDLPGRITKARNDLAHHLIQNKKKEPLEVLYVRWLVASSITPWLLRGLLLLRAGVAPDVLHSACLRSNRFENFRANVSQFITELGWDRPDDTEDEPDEP